MRRQVLSAAISVSRLVALESQGSVPVWGTALGSTRGRYRCGGLHRDGFQSHGGHRFVWNCARAMDSANPCFPSKSGFIPSPGAQARGNQSSDGTGAKDYPTRGAMRAPVRVKLLFGFPCHFSPLTRCAMRAQRVSCPPHTVQCTLCV